MSKKGENIYKRRDGRWEARYPKEHRENGTLKYGYCYAKTYAEVKQKLNLCKANWLNGTAQFKPENGVVFWQCCQEWLQLKRSVVKPSTYAKYQTILNCHLQPALGSLPPQQLTTVGVEAFGYSLLHEKGLSAKTVRDILTVLAAILRYSAQKYPVLGRVQMVYPKANKGEMRVLSVSEQKRLVAYLLQGLNRYKFASLLALLTGLRIGEVCALKWGDINLKKRLLCVTQTVQRLNCGNAPTKTALCLSTPKSANSYREVPLCGLALQLCQRFKEKEKSAYLLTGNQNIPDPRTLQYRFAKFASDCHLAGVHFHTLRHSFATRCIEVGFDVKSLSEILGHSGTQLTLERYVHSSLELKAKNMKRLAAMGY